MEQHSNYFTMVHITIEKTFEKHNSKSIS